MIAYTIKIIAHLWLFVSCVAGIISGIQYLYRHLQWIA
jgi:hypothetical protein